MKQVHNMKEFYDDYFRDMVFTFCWELYSIVQGLQVAISRYSHIAMYLEIQGMGIDTAVHAKIYIAIFVIS